MGECPGITYFLVGGAVLALATFAGMVYAIWRDYYRQGGRGGRL
jgi:hypothetical protein